VNDFWKADCSTEGLFLFMKKLEEEASGFAYFKTGGGHASQTLKSRHSQANFQGGAGGAAGSRAGLGLPGS
jgi:hypothetical protein